MDNKERIEKIKEVHLERIKQNEFYTASFIHVDWLIEQAEKLEKLQKYNLYSDFVKRIEELEEELIGAYRQRGDMYMAGEKEWIDNRIEELKS